LPYQGQISAGEAGGRIRAEARIGIYSLTLPIAPLVVCPDGAGLSAPSKTLGRWVTSTNLLASSKGGFEFDFEIHAKTPSHRF
jgi:hypothetical protein